MKEEPTHFSIEQDAGGTTVETITPVEYVKKYSVMVMEHALQLRRDTFSFPEGNVVDLIMEQFIRDRIPIQRVEKIVISLDVSVELVMYAGYEVTVSPTPKHQQWIFDGIIPIEGGDTTQGKYEIHLI